MQNNILALALLLASAPALAQEPTQDAAGPHPAFAACLQFQHAACDVVARAEPGNLTALFLRGLAAALDGDQAAALADFDAVARREPRHFGAQLWRHIAAASLGKPDGGRFAGWLARSGLPPWPKGLGQHYLGTVSAADLLALAAAQPAATRAEALCAAHYHVGRVASLAGDGDAAAAAFAAAVATGAAQVFEYRAARLALEGMR